MRTTVTLDPDVERLLKLAMHRERKSFKQVLNEAIRTGLKPSSPRRKEKFTVRSSPLGLRPGFDSAGFNKLADEMEAESVSSRIAQAK